MKTIITLIVIILLLIVGCSVQKKEYPDISIKQVIEELKWDMNFDKVRKILENKYELEFSHEIKQNDNKSNGKVYEFLGGKIDGINTHRWTFVFEKDSLINIIIIVESEKVELNQKAIQIFKKNINNLSYNKFSKIENEWIISEKENPICRIQLSGNKNGVILFFGSNKFINKYSYM